MITQERLKELLHYDPLTGVFMWPQDRGRAGRTTKAGYITIRVDGKEYRAHRLAFLYVTGAWPIYQLDHRDRNRANNRWKNLRPATATENARNRPVRACNKLGQKSICNYQGYFMVRVSGMYIGLYKTLKEAIVERDKATKEIQGDFAFVS